MDTYHILPINDLEPHTEELSMVVNKAIFKHGHIYKKIKSDCKCKPLIKYEPECVLVVHNSFDGREGIEWANEILQ